MSSLAKAAFSKHIKKAKAPGGKPSKNAVGPTNKRKTGEATAKRMKDRLAELDGKGKGKRSKEMDEEIDSDIAEMDVDAGGAEG
jgi:hypothetical protein